MFFQRTGQFAIRYRYVIIAAWFAVSVIVTLAAPNFSDVTTSDTGKMLPQDTLSADAKAVYEKAFPGDFAPGSAIIVVDAEQAGGVLNREAAIFEEQTDTPTGRFLRELETWLSTNKELNIIQRVVGPTSSPTTAQQFVDPTNQIALVSIELTTDVGDDRLTNTLEEIDSWLKDHCPANINVYLSGEAPIKNAFLNSSIQTAKSTLIVTVILVIALLLLIYRSPVSPLIPLIAVSMSYLITRGIAAWLAKDLLDVSTYADILLVVVMFGAGTDYCLFMISRFREEMADRPEVSRATTNTLAKVGETITSSAGTVFVGFMAMVFAQFGILNTSGPTLAIGIAISLLCGLTFVPAVLSILGSRAFWPGRAAHRSPGRFYAVTSQFVSSHPLITVVLIVLIMLPLAIHGLGVTLTYGMLNDLPDDTEAKVGFEVMQNALGPGNLAPLTIVATDRDPAVMAREMVQLEQDITQLGGVAQVYSLNNPTGQSGEMRQFLRVDTQLGLILQMMTPSAESGIPAGPSSDTLLSYVNQVAEGFPEIATDPNLVALQGLLADSTAVSEWQDEVIGAIQGLRARFATVDNPYLMLSALTGVIPAETTESAMFAQLFSNFVTADGTGYRMTVLLADDPESNAALDTVEDMRDILTNYGHSNKVVVSGQPAVTADMRSTIHSDLLLTIGFVMAGIFIVLLLMLRSIIAPIYLILTVVLSYLFTLGLTELVFSTFFDTKGVLFILPIFSFVFLVALGIDYSIFLIGRVKEEVAHYGMRDGIHVAVVSTGSIITSAGMILAGTFGAMIAGEILSLKELGFAVAVGVLVDTFVVRTMLVPAITIVLGKAAWWPRGISQSGRTVEQIPEVASAD